MLCLSAGSAATGWFLFSPFFFLATQGLPRMWPFCILWLLLLAWCFLWQAGYWNAPFRERQMEPKAEHSDTNYFSLWLSLFFLPLALHSNISWAPTSSRPQRGTSATRQRDEKMVLVTKVLPFVTLCKCSPWFTWQNMRKLSQMISWETFLFSYL